MKKFSQQLPNGFTFQMVKNKEIQRNMASSIYATVVSFKLRGNIGAVVVFASGFLLCCGCGSKGELSKVIVKGQVSFEGEPVENGDILFYPMPGTSGPVSGASIKDGHYIANAKGGVPVGKQRVKIRAYRGVGSNAENDLVSAGANPGGGREQYLPAKYNKLSETVVTIEGKVEESTLDFHLKP